MSDARRPGPAPAPRRARLRRLGKLALGVAVALLGGLGGFSVWAERVGIAPEPALAARPPIEGTAPVLDRDGVARLGSAWSVSVGGVRFVHLAGEPFELGYQNARLSQPELERLEDMLFRMKDAFVPWRPFQWILRKFLLARQRALPDFVSDERKREILGLVRGSRPDRHADEAPLYHRVLQYHSIHDVAHLLIDSPFVHGHWDELQAACTGFAAAPPATEGGSVLLARNFDFEAGRIFDEEKVVFLVEPRGGIPFAHVAWSGMAGGVTGLNALGIAVALNASASDDDVSIGTPVSLVLREVLEHAHSLDEAVAIVRAAKVFVSDSFLLASGREGRVAVVERSPARCAVREAKDGLVLAANHFLSPEFAKDGANARRRRDATTEERLARLEALTTPLRGKLTPERALEVLRDRSGPGGSDVGLGNRGAIDALIATHAVVADARAGVLWVSSGPHTLGRFLRLDVGRTFAAGELDRGALEAGAFPEDPLLASGEYARHVAKRRALIGARAALDAGDLAAARARAEGAIGLDPLFFEGWEVLARVALARGDRPAAAAAARAALERAPPFAALREELAGIASRS